MTDIEIARSVKLEKIDEIAKEIGIDEENIELYGKYKAKISNEVYNKNKEKKNGKLILVTAISPTPLGEGKTTVSIAIADGLKKIGKNSILALREPSLGPVFGIKGGATGGGKVQIAPMEDINLHFTGDIHAITAANNLLSSMIDNHIYFGNELGFKKVVWKRCMDLNDRQLRKVETGLSGEKKIVPREDGFDITVASEIMAIVCLSKDLKDLKEKLGNIIVGYNNEDKPIFAKDLKANGAMAVLLKDAIKPNLVQTLEHTPAIVHGGPFANIAHGCSSIKSINLARSLSDYVITEAGFGSDLGAEKFLDIVCPKAGINPSTVVLVVTIRALKYNGDGSLEKGISNVDAHLNHLKHYNVPIVVAINKFSDDSLEDISYVKEYIENLGYQCSVSDAYNKGGEGAVDLAKTVIKSCSLPSNFNTIVDDSMDIEDKIKKLNLDVYNSSKVEYSDEAKEKLKLIDTIGLSHLPICVAKTQYSISDNSKLLGYPKDNILHVRDLIINSGAGFITVLSGKIYTMPGLPKNPNYENIDLVDGKIRGLF